MFNVAKYRMRKDMYEDVHEHFDGVKIEFCSSVRLALAENIHLNELKTGRASTFLKTNCHPDQNYVFKKNPTYSTSFLERAYTTNSSQSDR
jgi:hypothetical protein